MRFTYLFPKLVCLSALIFATTPVPAALAAPIQAPDAAVEQRTFATSDEAVKALRDAVKAGDKNALTEIFGPDLKKLLTKDPVQDNSNFEKFSQSVNAKCEPEKVREDKVILVIGPDSWPFPIPLMRLQGVWYFDTEEGKDEIVNRHIGRDELNAIGVCHSYLEAQRKYFDMNPEGVKQYAQKFKSTPGKKDGLYWKSDEGTNGSPFGALVAEAHAEGYGHHGDKSTGPHPYHGYIFKILTRQGYSAQGGKMDYMVDGKMTGGFALVAYPDSWDQSGIMTFIVNQDGKVYQRNLGKGTVAAASAMAEYNPGRKWKLVEDEGITEK